MKAIKIAHNKILTNIIRFAHKDPSWLQNIHVNLRATERQAAELSAATPTTQPFASYSRLQWALKVLSLIDLTTLAGDDTRSNVQRLCQQAAHPFAPDVAQRIRNAISNATEATSKPTNRDDIDDGESVAVLTTAAVCVYPSRVADAHQMLDRMQLTGRIRIAAVATGFPSGQYALATRLTEIELAIRAGATEIDIVLDRALVLTGRWSQLHAELSAMRLACGDKAHMKAILAVGECGTLENVYRAALVAMMCGADFVKTSTGKEAVNATLTVGLVMVRAIGEFRRRTGRCVGLKPAGGVRTLDEALAWLRLVANTLGADWLRTERFRFGASGLLDSVVQAVMVEIDGVGGSGCVSTAMKTPSAAAVIVSPVVAKEIY